MRPREGREEAGGKGRGGEKEGRKTEKAEERDEEKRPRLSRVGRQTE